MGKQQAQTSKEMIWRDLLARHAASGKSIAAFCRTEAISRGNFYAWRTKLHGGAAGLPVPATQPSFIDLGALTSTVAIAAERSPALTPARSPTPSIDLRIALGGGIVLTVTRH